MRIIKEGEGVKLVPTGDPNDIEIIITRRYTVTGFSLRIIALIVATGIGGALANALTKLL